MACGVIALAGVGVGAWNREWNLSRALMVWLGLGFVWALWGWRRSRADHAQQVRTLSTAMDQCQSGILILDREGRVEFANQAYCAQSGWARHDLTGRAWSELQCGEASPPQPADVITAARGGTVWAGRWQGRRRDGSVYPLRGTLTAAPSRDGGAAGCIVVGDDEVESNEREAELRDARDRAQAGDRAKGHFLATMSHEVRTPLNGIVGFTSLLLDTPLTSEQREYVQTIRMSTEALIQLTGDILDFARIESGKLKLDPMSCDPRECIEDALDLLAPKADAKRIELLHHVGADVPVAVMADGGRLRQVLANLIGNAIKFTDGGEVEVSVRRIPAASAAGAGAEESCSLEFSVRDTGIGIAPENHEKLFRAFSQVDESTTRRYGGTGLGLAICRNLVELMGGRIGLESAPGQGATFRFTIQAPVITAERPERNLTGLRLGLVVQTVALRAELAQLIRGWGGDVIGAESPDESALQGADIVLVEVRKEEARAVALRPSPLFGFPAEKLLGLVPVTLSNDLRTGLRAHFRLLVNKPVHHDGFFALLAGSMGGLPAPRALAHFGFRVLLVGNDAVNQLLVERVLASLGCTTTAVENGPKALAVLERQPQEIDLVMLDVQPPGLDGLDFLREIRAGRAGVHAQTLWTIALTADARDEQRARGMSAGLNDYLTKPLRPADLEVALRAYRIQRDTQRR